MNMQQAAIALNGNQYGAEGSKELWRTMRADGLVAIFGASDDLAELRGAIDDEVEIGSNGGGILLTKDGLFQHECDNDGCPHEKRLMDKALEIEACFDDSGYTWTYRTKLPHATFEIMEGDEKYCRGIVIDMDDVRMACDVA